MVDTAVALPLLLARKPLQENEEACASINRTRQTSKTKRIMVGSEGDKERGEARESGS